MACGAVAHCLLLIILMFAHHGKCISVLPILTLHSTHHICIELCQTVSPAIRKRQRLDGTLSALD